MSSAPRSVLLLLLAIPVTAAGAGETAPEPELSLACIAPSPAEDYAPVWSSDGHRLLFYSWRENLRDLWVVPDSGGPPTRLESGAGNDGMADWGRDGRIIFSSYAPGATTQDIFILEPGGSIRPAIENPSDDYSPSWAPDGRSFLFISDRGGEQDVWIADPDRPGSERLLIGGAGSKHFASWSAAGDRVLFGRVSGDSSGIWAAPMANGIAGTPKLIVAARGAYLKHPAWGRGDRAIAYVRIEAGKPELWICSLEGAAAGTPRRLALPADLAVNFPDWSPDGTRLAFSAYRGGTSHLYVVALPRDLDRCGTSN